MKRWEGDGPMSHIWVREPLRLVPTNDESTLLEAQDQLIHEDVRAVMCPIPRQPRRLAPQPAAIEPIRDDFDDAVVGAIAVVMAMMAMLVVPLLVALVVVLVLTR